MPRSDKIRNYGLIPERRHDAFLLALLLALALNAAFFAIQAIIPRIASLLQLLGPEAALAAKTARIHSHCNPESSFIYSNEYLPLRSLEIIM